MTRSATRLFVLCLSLVFARISFAEQLDFLKQFEGIYRLEHDHLISVAIMASGNDHALVYTDLDSHQIRRLDHAGGDTFTAGPTFSVPAPYRFRFDFHRDAAEKVSGLTWTNIQLELVKTGDRQPLISEDVSFANGTLELHGVVHRPDCHRGKLPLIVWIHGSSRAERFGLFGLPQILAYHGFPVLAYDKRGVGASQGEYASAGLEELALDAASALAAMRDRPEFDPAHIGVMGTSQGGWVSFLTARLSNDVRFIIDLYGTPVSVGDQMLFDLRRDLEAAQYSRADIEKALVLQQQAIDFMSLRMEWTALEQEIRLAADEPWFEHVFFSYEGDPAPAIRHTGVAKMVRYEPLADIRSFRGPVLYMLGDFDRLVDVDRSTSLMARTLADAGNTDFTVVVFPKGHHGLTLGFEGHADERFSGLSSSTRLQALVPGYIDTLLRWLRDRVGSPPRCH